MSETLKPELKVVGAPPDDAADLSDLWLDPALGGGLTDTIWTSIPVGKPKDFFRVNPDKDFQRRTEIFTLKVEGQVEEQHFIVGPSMRGKIEEARPTLLVTCIYRDGSPRLWPLKFPRPDEKDNDAWVSARAAAREGLTHWIRIVWQRRAYLVKQAQDGYAPDPDWTKLPSFDQMVLLAFGPNGIIRDTSHPVYRDLIGAAARPSHDGGDADSLL